MVDKGRPTVRRSKEVEAAKILWDVLRLFLSPVPNEHCRKSPTHRSPSPLSPRFSFANSSRGSCRRYSLNPRSRKHHELLRRLLIFLWKKEKRMNYFVGNPRSHSFSRGSMTQLWKSAIITCCWRNDFPIANIFQTSVKRRVAVLIDRDILTFSTLYRRFCKLLLLWLLLLLLLTLWISNDSAVYSIFSSCFCILFLIHTNLFVDLVVSRWSRWPIRELRQSLSVTNTIL